MSELDIQPALVTELLVSFLREEVASAGLARTVVGLSGGVDSAVVAALCARAFGPESVLAVMLPYRLSNPKSLADARAVGAQLALPTRSIDISAMADGYLEGEHVGDARRRGNVLARCRMTILYDLSVEWRGLVIGTSNKSEILLGYSTQWGDGAHALNPLGDLYKTQVRELSRALSVPKSILDKPPSADLWPEQTDEADLGVTYDEVDRILALLVDARVSPGTIVAKGFRREIVLRVQRLIMRSQFKRRMPLIAKVSTRSIGWDFRYARDWKT